MINVGFGVTQFLRGSANNTLDGIGQYTHALYSQLNEIHDLNLMPFSFGFKAENDELSQQLNLRKSYTQHLIKTYFTKPNSPFAKQAMQPDIIHAPDHLTPVMTGMPLITTVMDAIPLSNPEWVTRNGMSLSNFRFKVWKKAIRRSDRIITASNYSKQQISEFFEIDESKISVAPLGVDARFYEGIDATMREKVIDRLMPSVSSYFLSVGTLQPRKNIKRVITAMKLLSEDVRKAYPIVIVGRLGWSYKEDEALVKEAVDQGWCYWLKRVTDFELRCLLQSSKGLVFPSLSEGFGLPVLEGFASKTPVLTSNITSMPEVAGDAALLVDPYSVEDIAQKILLMLDEGLMQKHINAGLKRCADFTWQHNAMKTVEVYKSLL